MSLFEKFDQSIPNNEKQISEYEAWIAILYACLSSDGENSESETDLLVNSIYTKEKFLGIQISPLYEKVMKIKNEIGQLKFLDMYCPVITENERPTLFSLAVDLTFADGELHREERNVIDMIAKRFQLNEELASKIIEVMMIKNKGNILNK